MSRFFLRISRGCIAVTAISAVGLITSVAKGQQMGGQKSYQQQWIANNNNMGIKADDLELMFSGPVGNAKLSGNPGLSGQTTTVNNAMSYTFNGLGVNDGTEVNVRWSSTAMPPPTITGGNWTVGGLPIKAISQANMNIMGRPAQITYNDYIASATFTNDQDFAVSYTNVTAYIDSDPSNFNIDDFDTASGTQVNTVPSSFTLAAAGDPGDSMTYALGTINPDDYELVFATAAPSSDPSDAFPNAAAAMLPEPTMGLSLLLVVPLLAGRRKKRGL